MNMKYHMVSIYTYLKKYKARITSLFLWLDLLIIICYNTLTIKWGCIDSTELCFGRMQVVGIL